MTSGFHLWQFQVFYWCRGIGGSIVLIEPSRYYLFAHTGIWAGDLGISKPALKHWATVTSGFHFWNSQVFIPGGERLVVVLFRLDMWEIFFLPTLGLGLGSSESQVLQSNIMPQWILVFTSHNFKYFTLDGSNWWNYGFDWTIWKIYFLPTIELKLETSGSQVQHSVTESEWFWISLLTISFI